MTTEEKMILAILAAVVLFLAGMIFDGTIALPTVDAILGIKQ